MNYIISCFITYCKNAIKQNRICDVMVNVLASSRSWVRAQVQSNKRL